MTLTLDKSCAYPECATRFVPATVQVKYCPDHRGRNSKTLTRHAARSVAQAESLNKVCVLCGQPFIAPNHRYERCETCAELDWVVWGPDSTGSLRFERYLASPGGELKPKRAPFIAIDGEGVGRGKDHRYVLLSVGPESRTWPDGVKDIREIFSFLYRQFEANSDAIFCGFYLSYDFNNWLRLLPRDRAWMLLTDRGIAKRKRTARNGNGTVPHLAPHPVEYRGWQFDMLGVKRFKLRPKRCQCKVATCKCPGQAAWMYICDAGPFYQTSLLNAINPKRWESPIVSQREYDILAAGKERRDSAVLDNDMIRYNVLENEILSRLMIRLRDGLTHAAVNLKKQQWFGPGQAAQAWMRRIKTLDIPTRAVRDLTKINLSIPPYYDLGEKKPIQPPSTIYDALVRTYYGGWFEIPVHGYVPGITYEYDINSAYPSIASKLPCLCGTWTHGPGNPRGRLTHAWLNGEAKTKAGRKLRLCHITADGSDRHLGPLPYRKPDGRVFRPSHVEGWYWQHEIDATIKAGLIDSIVYHYWVEYTPCDHEAPLKQLHSLYSERLSVGKNTPAGIAFKLIYNSVYGKFAQSEGDNPVFGNPAYASLITSGCRTQILNAIATHPGKSSAVAMVATDGVYFLAPHPGIDQSITDYLSRNPGKTSDDRLGQWSREEKPNLTLFKPGVYWDDKAREAIAEGRAPQFKSRGINALDFARSIKDVDSQFLSWGGKLPGAGDWPRVDFKSRFIQVSVKQALQWTEGLPEGKREAAFKGNAGRIIHDKQLTQDSNPSVKRNPHQMTYDADRRIYRSSVWSAQGYPESTPYVKRFGIGDNEETAWEGYETPDGPAMMAFRQTLGVG